MAHLANIFTGDDEDGREFPACDDAAIYGRCPGCGLEHGAGFCPEPGDLEVCACGLMHDGDAPATAGHGVVL